MSAAVVPAIAAFLALIFLLLALFIKPVRGILFLLLHSAAGWVGLYIWNMFAPITLGINMASASIAGILGLPGLFLMLLAKLILKL